MGKFTFHSGTGAPFGATYREDGVNFSVFSQHAQNIDLCLFDDSGQREFQKIPLYKGENHCWHIFVEDLPLCTKYAYRADGPYEPQNGLRFNNNKLLIDPYARQLDRDFDWSKTLFGYKPRDPQKDLSYSDQDSAPQIPKSIVCERLGPQAIEDIQSRKPRIPWSDTIIYETHVRGFSQLNTDIPEELRGTLSGLSHDVSIAYLKSLGVTAVELLPVHSFIDEEFLTRRGLSNYWGYNTLSFFCVHPNYLSTGDPKEFLQAVEKLHAAGLEVILDVVYNHTAESNKLGPTLSFRGLDNSSYYRLERGEPREYVNDTGCGNTIRAEHPKVLQLILDSLRFWAGEMGVDGFRFDLASILGRDDQGFNSQAAFFQAIAQDPLLSTCKLIAEPWDIGPGGYQLGSYPGVWSEWNDKYRDICRRFWKCDAGVLPEFARRIHGSSDLFEYAGRTPRASVNFICSHDGFTMKDLVSYRKRHNLANKEQNRDGHQGNHSANYGVEGETNDEKINAIRRRQQRNLIATLLLSQGTPMLLGGDELCKTQQGNNNAYCQDNEINWQAWEKLDKHVLALKAFTSEAIKLRQKYSVLRSETYIHKPEDFSQEKKSARWISPLGLPMTIAEWHDKRNHTLGWILDSLECDVRKIILMLFNASERDIQFQLPPEKGAEQWHLELDTFVEHGFPKDQIYNSNTSIKMESRTLKVLVATTMGE